MSFAKALAVDIEQNWDRDHNVQFYFGTPAGADKPYAVMQIVLPLEQPFVFCEEQGETGSMLMQFAAAAGSFMKSYNLLESLKDYVAAIQGTIAREGVTYNITNNVTNGVQEFDVGLNTWEVIFESTFDWAIE